MADPQQQSTTSTSTAAPVGPLDLSKSISLQAPAAPAAAGPTLDMSKSIPLEQTGVMSRVGNAALDLGKGIVGGVENMIKPPEGATEGLMQHVGGDPSLFAYRAAKGVTEAADRMLKATPGEYQQAVADYKKAVDEFHNKDYRNAAASAGSAASDVMSMANPIAPSGRPLTEGLRKNADLATPLTKDALIAGSIVAPEFAGDALGAVGDAASRATNRLRINPFRSTALADAADAVRGGVNAAADTHGVPNVGAEAPIVQGNQSVFDEPLKNIASKEKAAYNRLDQAAGFDLKAAKDQLSLDLRATKQPGVTPEALKSLQSRITENLDHISQAEKNLTDQGIDPKEGDRYHTARMAGQDVKNAIVKTTNTDGTIDLNKVAKRMQDLRFAKRGDRLEQFMGKDGADTFMKQLTDAQKAGVHAMDVAKFYKWAAGIAGVGLVGAAGVEGAKHAISLLAP